jgi:hypothetical protein
VSGRSLVPCSLSRDAIATPTASVSAASRPLRQLRIRVGIHQRTKTFFVIEYHEREVSGELHEEP